MNFLKLKLKKIKKIQMNLQQMKGLNQFKTITNNRFNSKIKNFNMIYYLSNNLLSKNY